jgi:hypothetical protein
MGFPGSVPSYGQRKWLILKSVAPSHYGTRQSGGIDQPMAMGRAYVFLLDAVVCGAVEDESGAGGACLLFIGAKPPDIDRPVKEPVSTKENQVSKQLRHTPPFHSMSL